MSSLARVDVPETAMHEDYTLQAGEDQIGRARQITSVQPVAIAHAVDEPPNNPLRLSVHAPDPRHTARPLFASQIIRHLGALYPPPGAAGVTHSPWT